MSTGGNGGNGAVKRNLPSWMSARDDEEEKEAKNKSSKAASSSQTVKNEGHSKAREAKSSASSFSKLMEGVVFVLSGFVNPERGTLRSQALEMGAEYQPDWNSDCTLLICAFPNTPKARQVAADGGTIVSKEWISECHKQKKLAEIDPYLMHAGKPWKRQSVSHEANQDQRPSTSRKPAKQVEKGSHSKPAASASSKGVASNGVKNHFLPSRVKEWAIDDFSRTVSWLESQDEKPEPDEIKKIAAEGILTCLQDTIDSLEQGQDIQQITEQWACIPRVVEELGKFDSGGSLASPGKTELCKQAMACKQIYQLEFSSTGDEPSGKRKSSKTDSSGKAGRKVIAKSDASYDSDETIEMTEEEIDQAYNTIASTVVHV